MKSDMKRKKMFAIGLILSLIIFFTINAVSYWSTKKHIESTVNVEKTLTILYELENLISMIKDAENGQRGFIITGSWTFLEPYYNGITAVHKSMRALKELTPIGDQAYQKLDVIQGMIEKRFVELYETIILRKERGLEVAIKSVMADQDEKVMTDIRNLVAELKHEKTHLLQELNRISEARSYHTLFTILAGNLVAFLFVFFSLYQLSRDIAERKRAEEALRESEDKFKYVFDYSVIGKSITFPTGKMLANKVFYEMLGYSKEEFLDLKWQQITHPDDVALSQRNVDSLIAGEKDSVRFIKRYFHKDGSIVWTDVGTALRRDKEGKPLYFIASISDITDRKRAEVEKEKLEAQLFQSQKMESVGLLAGGIAHDYNNISSIIIGYSELALEKLDQDNPLHDDLMEIFTAAKRSTDITRQLLAFARQQTIAPKVLDLNDTIESMLKMLRRLIGEDIDLAWLPGAKVWPIKIDPSQVDQILASLCVNARDAIAGVGKITIETKNISFDENYCADHAGFVPGEYVLFAVSDDGSGIAPETLGKIFEPFFTTKDLGHGTGLGLATVYGIVKQNNGFINVYSEPEEGTTIKIYLSRHTGEIEAHHKSPLKNPISRGETVLLVEDDGSIMKLGKKFLNGLGYSVLSATTPSEAISLAEEHADEINLLVTDVVMPEMNGRELSEQLKRLYPNLKILFMSGYTANVIAHRGVLEDGVCFMPKPFSKKDLAVKVREALDNDNG